MEVEFHTTVKYSYQSIKMQDGTSQRVAMFRNKLVREGTVTSAIVATANTLVHNVPLLWHRPKHNYLTLLYYVVSTHAMKAQRGCGSIATLILNLSAGRRCLVSLKLQPLYSLVERPQYALRGWMGPIINLTSFHKQFPSACWNSNP